MTSPARTSSGPASPDRVASETARLRAEIGSGLDLERLRQLVDSMVPFNNFVGVRITELTREHATAELAVRPDVLNHFGTIHAGAMFLVAEVAGAGAFSGALAPRITQMERFVLRESNLAFLKPAKGGVRARATMDQVIVDDVLSRTTAERFQISGKAVMQDEEDTVVARFDLDYVAWVGAAG